MPERNPKKPVNYFDEIYNLLKGKWDKLGMFVIEIIDRKRLEVSFAKGETKETFLEIFKEIGSFPPGGILDLWGRVHPKRIANLYIQIPPCMNPSSEANIIRRIYIYLPIEEGSEQDPQYPLIAKVIFEDMLQAWSEADAKIRRKEAE